MTTDNTDNAKNIKSVRTNMSMNMIGGLVSLIVLFGVIACVIGQNSIVSAFKNEYSTVTYHMADSAAIFVNGDHIDDYLAGEEMEEYAATKEQLDTMCDKMNVSLIYVIKVDTNDYGRFVSVFNSVNNSVDDSNYTEWELGHPRDTTNDQYRETYKSLYNQETAYGTIFRLKTTDGQHPHITTLVPVKDSSGNVVAILCVQRPVREMSNAVMPYFRRILIGVFIIALLISLLAAGFLKKSVIRPVEKISNEAIRFAKERQRGEPIGEIGQYDIIHDLAQSIDIMEVDMVDYIENIAEATAEKERMGAELSIAAQIQNDALPKTFPAFPDRGEFDIYASMDPAREVGGDFYNYLLIDDDHLALIMADVSGKGIPAALFMEQANILLCDRTAVGGTPAEVLSLVNDIICDHNSADMFVTVWLGILEISTGRLITANAGHEDPVICRGGTGFEIVKDDHGFVLGGLKGMKYKDREFFLRPGDKLFVYTDGVPEATAANKEMFGTDRMVAALNENAGGTPEDILTGMQKTVDDFVGEAEQFDDLTMMCLEYRGK